MATMPAIAATTTQLRPERRVVAAERVVATGRAVAARCAVTAGRSGRSTVPWLWPVGVMAGAWAASPAAAVGRAADESDMKPPGGDARCSLEAEAAAGGSG